MSKSKIMRIILIAGCLLIIVGVSLMGWMLATANERSVISVKLENGETEVLAFEQLALVPGEKCEYTIELKKSGASKYNLELNFVDTDEEKLLKNFARVKVMSGEEVVCDALLADAFQNEAIVLPVDFGDGKNTKLKVVYYLPLEVGNEAKKAEAAFALHLKASNE